MTNTLESRRISSRIACLEASKYVSCGTRGSLLGLSDVDMLEQVSGFRRWTASCECLRGIHFEKDFAPDAVQLRGLQRACLDEARGKDRDRIPLPPQRYFPGRPVRRRIRRLTELRMLAVAIGLRFDERGPAALARA